MPNVQDSGRRGLSALRALLRPPPAAETRTGAMSEAILEDSDGPPLDSAALLRAVLTYQQLHQEWRSATDAAAREALRERLAQAMQALWPLVSAALRPVARQWARSHQLSEPGGQSWAAAVEDTTTSLCLDVIDRLPRVPIREHENLVGLLRTIARRREIDNYRRLTRGQAGPSASPAETAAPAPSPRRQVLPLDDTLLQTCADSLSQGFEAAVIEREYRRDLASHVLAFCRAHLSADEAWILEQRLLREPPTPHEAIAAALGPPWNTELVRARFSRITRRIRQHLRDLGLLIDDTS